MNYLRLYCNKLTLYIIHIYIYIYIYMYILCCNKSECNSKSMYYLVDKKIKIQISSYPGWMVIIKLRNHIHSVHDIRHIEPGRSGSAVRGEAD